MVIFVVMNICVIMMFVGGFLLNIKLFMKGLVVIFRNFDVLCIFNIFVMCCLGMCRDMNVKDVLKVFVML